MDKAAVLGAGVMGARIAEIFALNGTKVILRDVDEKALEKGMATIKGDLEELVAFHAAKADTAIEGFEKKAGVELSDDQKATARENLKPTYTQERVERILANITTTTTYDGFDEVDLVIEAVPESLELKQKVLLDLMENTPEHTVVATNTSTISITAIAGALPENRRGRFLGVHFFNPPTQLPLIEVIPGMDSRSDIIEDVVNVFAPMRNFRFPMLPIVAKEGPGFIVNRILFPMFAEAFALYEEGGAKAKDIDLAMQAGAGMPMGPLALADLVGLDVILHAGRSMGEQGVPGNPNGLRPLARMVAAGRLGQKNGRGFHDYRKESY
ncbi:MAG: 3-hydroxyacyl-CoA dehydrogenase family protein [Thermoplasmatota archaeon]